MLPGPQGTLYGGAAAGGVINIATRLPGYDFGADGFVEFGNYDAFHLKAGVDIPISDRLQVRAVYDHVEHGPFESGGFYDENIDTGRIVVAFQPTDNLTGDVKVTYSKLRNSGEPIPGVPRGSHGSAYDLDRPTAGPCRSPTPHRRSARSRWAN